MNPAPAPARLPAAAPPLLVLLLVLAGVDGFQLLPALKELGSRVFYLVFWGLLLSQGWRQGWQWDRRAATWLGLVLGWALLGLLLSDLPPPAAGTRSAAGQFFGQGLAFCLGFGVLALGPYPVWEGAQLQAAARRALAWHLAFAAADWAAIALDLPRPFEHLFLGPGSVERAVPSGLCSEPSYLAAYVAILLPVCLRGVRAPLLAALALGACGLFYLWQTRTFFVIFPPLLLAMLHWQSGRRARPGEWLAGAALLTLAAVLALSIGLLDVESNLSSAFRLGNLLGFTEHALQHNWLLGEGLGQTHLVYPQLEPSAFLLLSGEYWDALDGETRALVFSQPVRLAVELGLLPAAFLLWWLWRRVRQADISVRLLLLGSLLLALSVDSYLNPLQTLALWAALRVSPPAPRPMAARSPVSPATNRSAGAGAVTSSPPS